MSSILDKLNEKQREAAEKVNGAVLILAGAGSGKTRTITYRIAHMIRELGISPYKILAVTFTNKAANEMKERVEDLVGEDGKRALISTFHSFGLRLLRVYGDKLGYAPNFTIYDTDDQKRLIKNIMKEMVINDKNITDRLVASIISRSKEEDVSPDDMEKDAGKYQENDKLIAEIFRKYNNTVKSNNAMDFADILLNTYRLLQMPDILDKVQEKFLYIMVDEYQDTNRLQYNIIKKISQKYGNICVVGDENQSIYGFRGADIHNILSFEEDNKDAVVIKLEENYRSTAVILDAANNVIKNNTTAQDKKLWTKKTKGDLITVLACDDGRQEVDLILEEIMLGKTQGKKYKDHTVLYRTNAQSRLFEEGCLRENIPYKVFGGMQFYQRAEVKDIIAYFSVVNNPRDDMNLNRIINVPKRKIGDKTMEKINVYAAEKGISLYDALRECDDIPGISPKTREQLSDLIKILDDLREISEYSNVSQMFEELTTKIEYKQYLEKNYEDHENREENIDELYNSIIELENVVEDLRLRDYLENVSLVSATDDLSEEKDYVKLMTIHNSKGLEFPVVFLAGAEDEIFPGKKADFSTADLEEERRLCYVAITRAEEKLYISYAKQRYVYGDLSYRTRSRFIDEIPAELLKINELTTPVKTFHYNDRDEKNTGFKYTFKKTITIEDLDKTSVDCNYKVGEKVMHKKFGLGVIRQITPKRLEIDFVSGKKEIALALADKFITKI